MITKQDIVQKALEYKDTPFHHTGRKKGINGGIDCSGLIVCVLNELGMNIPDFVEYSEHDGFHILIGVVKKYSIKIDDNQLEPGDILVFRYQDIYNHIGFYIGDNQFIHAYNSPTLNKVSISTITPYWKKRIHSTWEIKL